MIALILGCAECVWEDAARVLSVCSPDAIFAVKDMMGKWPARVDYGITLHPERTDEYLRERRRQNFPSGFEVWAHRNYGSQTAHKTTNDWAGSSGLFAVRVARKKDFQAIVLAGVPMRRDAGHVRRQEPWNDAQNFLGGWRHRKDQIAPFVRSMSGWTKETFGEPTHEWLSHHGSAEPDHEVISKLKEKGRWPN